MLSCPGRWNILKVHGSVFCFNANSLGLAMSSSEVVLKNPSSGLWSVTILRSLQPRVKYRVCSRDQAIARASPSTGEYRVSAGFKKREPARVICQPWSQHPGSDPGHEQCFWDKKYPIPTSEKSVCKQVGRLRSNI